MKITDRLTEVHQRVSRIVDHAQYALDLEGSIYPDLRDLRDEAKGTLKTGVKSVYPALTRIPRIEGTPVKLSRTDSRRYNTLILSGMPKSILGTEIQVKEVGLIELERSSRFTSPDTYTRAIDSILEYKGRQINVGVGIGDSYSGFAYYNDPDLPKVYYPYHTALKIPQASHRDELREELKGCLEEVTLSLILNKVLATVGKEFVFSNMASQEKLHARLAAKVVELGLKPESLHSGIAELYLQMC